MAKRGSGVVLDASAVIALLQDEPGADTVETVLRSHRARMSAVNVAEVIDVLVRVHRGEPDEVIAHVEELLSSAVEPIASSPELAIRAGELRARLFDRRSRRVSLADCFALATAAEGDRVVTGDRVLAAVARDQGIAVVALSA